VSGIFFFFGKGYFLSLPVNFERLDDAVRARKALNGRDVLGSDVGAIRIGFAKVPVKGAPENGQADDTNPSVGVQGVGDLTVGATIHALRSVKGASTIPADQQVLGGAVENYRSNLVLSMIGAGTHNQVLAGVAGGDAAQKQGSGWVASITEQQMIMKEITKGVAGAEEDIQALAGEAQLSKKNSRVFFTHLLCQNSARPLCIILVFPPFLTVSRPTDAGTRPSCVNCVRGWIRAR